MINSPSARLSFLLICTVALTACPTERFRHEKYVCNSGTFDINEIILNDTSAGDHATIIGHASEKKARILSSSQKSIAMQLDDTEIKIKRETGVVTVKRGKRYALISCSKSIFTM